MEQGKIISDKWSEDYNENHPHGSLRGMTPRQFTRATQEGFYDMIIKFCTNCLKVHCWEKGKSSTDRFGSYLSKHYVLKFSYT